VKSTLRIILITCAVIGGLVILWLAAPHWLITRNEREAQNILLAIRDAQKEFHQRHGVYGSIPRLRAEGLINLEFNNEQRTLGWTSFSNCPSYICQVFKTRGTLFGYSFTVSAYERDWYCSAKPGKPGMSGIHAFLISSNDDNRVRSHKVPVEGPSTDNWLSRLLGD